MSRFHRYTVRGSGTFPIDMLRYDQAWPAMQADVVAIEPDDSNFRVVVMESHTLPTLARWESFCWQVVEIDGREVRQ